MISFSSSFSSVIGSTERRAIVLCKSEETDAQTVVLDFSTFTESGRPRYAPCKNRWWTRSAVTSSLSKSQAAEAKTIFLMTSSLWSTLMRFKNLWQAISRCGWPQQWNKFPSLLISLILLLPAVLSPLPQRSPSSSQSPFWLLDDNSQCITPKAFPFNCSSNQMSKLISVRWRFNFSHLHLHLRTSLVNQLGSLLGRAILDCIRGVRWLFSSWIKAWLPSKASIASLQNHRRWRKRWWSSSMVLDLLFSIPPSKNVKSIFPPPPQPQL